MPGFFIHNLKKDCRLQTRYAQSCIYDEMKQGLTECCIKRHTLRKFLKDKCFEEREHYIVIGEGCLLNKRELLEKYQMDDIAGLMIFLYQKQGEEFFRELIGDYSGALYDADRKRWIIWTSQTGHPGVFYYSENGRLAIGSEVNYVLDILKENGIHRSLNREAAYEMLTFAFMEKWETYANEVHRLPAGHYLRFENGRPEMIKYHELKHHFDKYRDASDDEILEELDGSFRKAIRAEFEKDREYGFDHLCDLSGGLDSRMIVWMAHELGYRNIQLISYCKSDYLDEKIAKQIAEHLRLPLLFKPLDDLCFLYDVDDLCQLTNGLSLYDGITGGKALLESLNFDRYGIEHNGIAGGSVVGCFYSRPEDIRNMNPTGRYSERLASRLQGNDMNRYESHEIYLIYVRLFQGAANTYCIRRHFYEPLSPYLYPDFLQLCMDIEPERRMDHRLYLKWIMKKHPEAGQFTWEHGKFRPADSDLVKFYKKVKFYGPRFVARKLHIPVDKWNRMNMNPIDYWISHNPELQSFLDQELEESISFLPMSVEEPLYTDVSALYKNGNSSEKAMALTLLKSCQMYLEG